MAQTPAKLIQYPGSAIDYTPASNVAAGDVVTIGTIPMVAPSAIVANTQGTLYADGVWDLPKNADVFNAGDAVYWNASDTDLGSNTGAADNATGNLVGVAVAAAANTATHVRTKLTAAHRTTTIAGSVTADDITGSDSALAITGMAAANATDAGSSIAISGSAGGATSGDGGAVTIAGGAATAGNDNGGAVSIQGGAKHGTGADGAINIGTTNAGAITVGVSGATLTHVVSPRGPLSIVNAAGGNIATAGALIEGVNVIAASDNSKGVILPACVNGATCVVVNMVTDKTLKLYPPVAKQVNNKGANNAITLAANTVGIFWSEGANAWYGLAAATTVA